MAEYHDLTSLQDMLKNAYSNDVIAQQFQDEPITYNLFPVTDKKPEGLGYVFGLRNERAQSVGGRAESANLPQPMAGKYDQGKITPKYVYGSIRLTGPAIEAAKSNKGAFINSQSDAVEDMYKSIINDLNRQSHGDGFGLIGQLSTASETLSISADWMCTFDNDVGLMYAREGMVVDFFDSTAFDESSVASRINSIDYAAKTCEMEANVGTYKATHPLVAAQSYSVVAEAVPDAAYMVAVGTRAATHATTNASYEITGLDGIYDDGTLLAAFEGITVASQPKWKANVLGNSGVNRELELDTMFQADNITRKMAGIGKCTIRMGLGQRRNYANILVGDVRFSPENLLGGFERLTFAGGNGATEIVVDPLTQPNKIYFEPKGNIKRYELSPLKWGDLDQQWHQRSGYDQWDSFLRIYTNLGTEKRNHLTILKDLTEPSMY